jgi:septal ring-binding cell division protein DamX
MYFHGRGVSEDRSRGMELIRRSANQGDPKAIEALGVIASARQRAEQISQQTLPRRLSEKRTALTSPDEGRASATTTKRPQLAQQPERAAEAPERELQVADQWLAERDSRHYTIELLAVRELKTADRYRQLYLRRNPPPESVKVVEAQRRGRRWLLLVMGDYPDERTAQEVLADLPPLLKAANPSVRRFDSIAVPRDSGHSAGHGLIDSRMEVTERHLAGAIGPF